jgi:two-component system, OmpR family, sensor histidine kinase KdpD
VRSVAFAVLVVALATAAGALLAGVLGLEEIVMMYLLAILVVALRTDRVGASCASLLSVAAFDFFFVPPVYSFGVKDVRHLLTFIVMFTVGLVVSSLTLRARRARAEEMRSAILSSVSHDLRTPLSTIVGAASSLRDDARLTQSARRTLVESICEEADRLERLLSKVIAMTKVEAGLAPTTEPVPIEEPVGAALTRLEGKLAGHKVLIAIPEGLPFVSSDPVLLEQVFLNLIENFARHTPPETTLRISGSATGALVSIELADDGPGLPEQVRRHMFEKYNQGNPRSGAGQGLGLAICKGIVGALGGDLKWVDRAPGTTFRVALPVAEPSA